MSSNYLIMWSYALSLVLMFFAYGWSLSRLLKFSTISFGLQCATGLSFVIALGGYLNLFSLISKASLTIIWLLGLALALAFLLGNFQSLLANLKSTCESLKSDKAFSVLVLILSLIFVLKFSSFISPGAYNTGDDYQGYFVFPAKMIQTGSLGAEAFNERRLVSSLGGQYFLDSFVYLFGSPKNFSLIDYSVGYLLLILVAISLVKSSRLNKYLQLWLVAVVILTPLYITNVNITSVLTGAVLFLSLIALLQEENFSIKYLLVLSLIFTALCALKNSFVPVAVLLLLTIFFKNYQVVKTKQFVLKAIIFFITSLIFLSPWLLASYQSNGTLLYPMLGSGFHAAKYGSFPAPSSLIDATSFISFFFKVQNIYLFVFLLCLIFALTNLRNKFFTKLEFHLAIILILGVLIMGYGTAGYATDRYAFPFMMPIILVLLISLLSRLSNSDQVKECNIFLSLLVALGILVGIGANEFFNYESLALDKLKFGLRGSDLVSHEEQDRYYNLQNVVPAGATILAHLDQNYLFNFQRNKIFVVDYAGASSLPPGMPFFQGPEVLAKYLLSQQIDYVAYAYGNEAGFSRQQFAARLDPKTEVWIKAEAQYTFDFQDNLLALGKVKKRLYDDGQIFILDLQYDQ